MTIDNEERTVRNERGDVSDWFAVLFAHLSEAFPTVRPREGTVRVYAAAMKDLTREQITVAMNRAAQEREFWPSIANIRAYATPTADDAGLIAWNGFERAAASIGGYASLIVDDRAAAVALLMTFGSWPQFCQTETGPVLSLKRQEFLAHYRAARLTVGTNPEPRRIAGTCEHESGYEPTASVWRGRLTASGAVVKERDEPAAALPAAAQRKELADGGSEGR